MKNKKIIITILASFIILLLIKVFVFGTATLNVKTTRPGIFFTVGEQTIEAPSLVKKLKPGEYTITSHVSGYKIFEKKVRLYSGITTTVTLEFDAFSNKEDAISNGGESILKGDDRQEEDIQNNLNEREEKFPLTKYLPYFNDNFSFDYTLDKNNTPQYFIETDNYNRDINRVKEWIISLNINIDPINISII
ncbi:PEGA domain-containing protein, partial [bacterium]|nr:PEGA domain-containing protein [bacterium]